MFSNDLLTTGTEVSDFKSKASENVQNRATTC